MICSKCKQAGEIVAALRGGPTNPAVLSERKLKAAGLDYRTVSEDLALRLHDECKGGTWCDCQHALSGVNLFLMEREHADSK